MNSAGSATAIRGEIESLMPLQAENEWITVSGWCLDHGPVPPAVRLVTQDSTIVSNHRTKRDDIARQYPDLPGSAQACGFTLAGRIPAGVHVARFETLQPDGSWRPWRTHALVVYAAGLQAAIEQPTAHGTVVQRIHVSGWVYHPRSRITKLTLRYGHQSIPCDFGQDRPDASFDTPNGKVIAQAFRSRTNLSAGHGKIRLHARMDDGSTAVIRTDCMVKIDQDENHDGSIDFAAAPVAMPHPQKKSLPPRVQSHPTLNVLFVLHGSFAANSALHVTNLANELSRMGHSCTVAVTHDLPTLNRLPSPTFHAILHRDAVDGVTFRSGRGPDIIHAWTTRDSVRRLCEKLRENHRAKIIVHLEDNEQALLSAFLNRPWSEIERLPERELQPLLDGNQSHPVLGPRFLASVDAATAITESLEDFIPQQMPRLTFWPAADERFFFQRAMPAEFRRLLDRHPDETLLVYPGNVHTANGSEVRELYRAVRNLNAKGHHVTLLRTGSDYVDFLDRDRDVCSQHVITLGQLHAQHLLPEILALADMFVQPGADDSFNRYRFPSKLPEFFSIGRPVILPKTNIGRRVRHGEDAYVLDRADADGIAQAIVDLRNNPQLREHLSRGAVAFGARHFSWRRNAEALAKFYFSLTT